MLDNLTFNSEILAAGQSKTYDLTNVKYISISSGGNCNPTPIVTPDTFVKMINANPNTLVLRSISIGDNATRSMIASGTDKSAIKITADVSNGTVMLWS